MEAPELPALSTSVADKHDENVNESKVIWDLSTHPPTY